MQNALIVEFVTQQVSAHWLYQDGRVVIFRASTELNASDLKAYEKRIQIEQQIRNSKPVRCSVQHNAIAY
jgi:hypothetical protein